MQKNVVALADEEYDAITGPLAEEACRIIREIAGARAYLLPVIIASLEPYAAERRVSEGDESGLPAKARSLHRPHFRIHTSDGK